MRLLTDDDEPRPQLKNQVNLILGLIFGIPILIIIIIILYFALRKKRKR